MTAHKRSCRGLIQDETSSDDSSDEDEVNEDIYEIVEEEINEIDSFDVL